jgi:hypothetical protein
MNHALFYTPYMFSNLYPEYNGSKYLFTDLNNISKIQGTEILKQIQEHFSCQIVDGGILIFDNVN